MTRRTSDKVDVREILRRTLRIVEWRIPGTQLGDAPHCEAYRHPQGLYGLPAAAGAQCTNRATRMRQQDGSLHLSYYCDECKV